jgi:hypothetical protein
MHFFVAVFFILFYFGISLSHFKIAGGLVLLVPFDKGEMRGLGVVLPP